MIIHLNTMTVDELLSLQIEVFDVYCDAVCFAGLTYGQNRKNWQETARYAWKDLAILTKRIEELTGKTGCICNTGEELVKGDLIRVHPEPEPELTDDHEAAAARELDATDREAGN